MLNRALGGWTLVEALAYCTLLALFSLMLFMSFPARTNASMEDLNEAMVKAYQGLDRLCLELSNAASKSILLGADHSQLAFLAVAQDRYSLATYSHSGALAFKGWAGYYLRRQEPGDKQALPEQKTLQLVRSWQPVAADKPVSILIDAARDAILKGTFFVQDDTGLTHVLASRVKAFKIDSAENGVWNFTLALYLNKSEVILTTSTRARNP